VGCRTPPAGPEAGGYARAMEPAQSATPRPQGPRRVTTVLALLTAGLLTAGTGLVVLASPPALIGALALLLSLTPLAVAAVILRPRAPGPITTADHLTMLRLLGAGALAAVTVLALAGQLPSRGWVLAALIGAALASDGIDGHVARRTGTAGPIGARIDMEADAALVMALSALAAITVGPWVLAIGLMRYAYVAASRIRPALRRPLGYSLSRRLIGALQGVSLLAATVPVIPTQLATGILAVALALLVLSFGRDVIAQERAEWRAQAGLQEQA